MKSIIEIIKVNKKAIIKKTLIIGGTIAGLVLVTNIVAPKKDAENEAADTEISENDETSCEN